MDRKVHGIFLLVTAFSPKFTSGRRTRCFFNLVVSSRLFAKDLNFANGLRNSIPEYIRKKVNCRHLRRRRQRGGGLGASARGPINLIASSVAFGVKPGRPPGLGLRFLRGCPIAAVGTKDYDFLFDRQRLLSRCRRLEGSGGWAATLLQRRRSRQRSSTGQGTPD